MRVLGLPLDPPHAVLYRVLSDLAAVARAAQHAPAQLERMLELGEEIADIGRAVLEIAERLDERAEAILVVGARLDARAEAILELGARLDGRAEAILEMGARLDGSTTDLIELGIRMHDLGDRVDARGAEVAGQAGAVVETASELISVLPTLERALELATPLEGAIDRFGRLVDRLPGGRRSDAAGASGPAPRLDPGAPPSRATAGNADAPGWVHRRAARSSARGPLAAASDHLGAPGDGRAPGPTRGGACVDGRPAPPRAGGRACRDGRPAPPPSARVLREPGFAVLDRGVNVEGAEDEVVVGQVVEGAVHVVGAERATDVSSGSRGLGEVVDGVVGEHAAEVVAGRSATTGGHGQGDERADHDEAGQRSSERMDHGTGDYAVGT